LLCTVHIEYVYAHRCYYFSRCCCLADDDYDSGVINVTFGVGDTSAEISIDITDDSTNERNEAFGLVLKRTDDTPALVEIVDPMNAIGVIDDDDDKLSMFCGKLQCENLSTV